MKSSGRLSLHGATQASRGPNRDVAEQTGGGNLMGKLVMIEFMGFSATMRRAVAECVRVKMKFLPYMEYTESCMQGGSAVAEASRERANCLRSLRSSSLLDCLLDGAACLVSCTAKLKVSR